MSQATTTTADRTVSRWGSRRWRRATLATALTVGMAVTAFGLADPSNADALDDGPAATEVAEGAGVGEPASVIEPASVSAGILDSLDAVLQSLDDEQASAMASFRPAGWDWRNYFNCILGIGVPAGVAWFFVTTVGTSWLLNRAMLWASKPSFGPSPFGWAANWIIKYYAAPVWASCRAYVGS